MWFLHFVLDCAICFGLLAARFLGCNMLYLSVEMKYPSHPRKKKSTQVWKCQSIFQILYISDQSIYLSCTGAVLTPLSCGHLQRAIRNTWYWERINAQAYTACRASSTGQITWPLDNRRFIKPLNKYKKKHYECFLLDPSPAPLTSFPK